MLRINKQGVGLWCAKTKINGKTLNTSLGHYPEMSAATARFKKEEWLKSVRLVTNDAGDKYTLAEAYEEWSARKRATLKRFDMLDVRFRRYVLPLLGGCKMKDLTAYTFIQAWRPYEDRGMIRTLQIISGYVRQLAIFVENTGRVEGLHDLTHITSNYVRTKPVEHRAAVTPAELSDVFYTLERNGCPRSMTWNALMTVFYTLSRVNEIVSMEWSWVDFDNKVITFPEKIMKKGRPHTVPMSRQLIALLNSLPHVSEYVFASYGKLGHVVLTAPNRLLYDHGLTGRQTVHGIRSIGASWMAERGVAVDIAESCLAHVTGNATRMAYQRSEFLEQRRPVMQEWCDYVEQCRNEALTRIKTEAEK